MSTNTTPCFEYMFEVVRDSIANKFDHVSKSDAAVMLMDFEETHGREAIISVFGFLRYMSNKMLRSENRTQIREQIKITLAHDLNIRKNNMALPRSHGYQEFISI